MRSRLRCQNRPCGLNNSTVNRVSGSTASRSPNDSDAAGANVVGGRFPDLGAYVKDCGYFAGNAGKRSPFHHDRERCFHDRLRLLP